MERHSPRRRPEKGRPRSGPKARGPFTYRLNLEYDGHPFSGWQEQANARTVMGVLKQALVEAGYPPLDLGGAGRTDAGVHALGQTAHLRLARRAEPEALARAVNERLPGSVHLLAAAPAHPRFHARHDALSRSYLYQLSRRRTALARRYVWWVKAPLDAEQVREAAALLPGRHDFRLFAVDAEAHGSTLVEVEAVAVAEVGDLVLLRFVASHYLWRMVRRLVGTLVQVGTGQLAVEELAQLLDAIPLPDGRGTPAQWTAPACGLLLERVLYPGDAPLPPLAAATPVAVGPPATAGSFPAPGRRPSGGSRRRRR